MHFDKQLNFKKLKQKSFYRFLIAGGLNTTLTIIIFQLLLFFLDKEVSYLISWGTGLLILTIYYPEKVFRKHDSNLMDKLLIGSIYITTFFFGKFLLGFFDGIDIIPQYSIFIVIFITMILNYILIKSALRV
jgi:putative flippase GtrA